MQTYAIAEYLTALYLQIRSAALLCTVKSLLPISHLMSSSFWNTLAGYCQELSPVVGPLLGCVADTAEAIDRASSQTQSLRTISARTVKARLSPEDE